MLYFSTRSKARAFAGKSNRKVVDNGEGCAKRWAVEVL